MRRRNLRRGTVACLALLAPSIPGASGLSGQSDVGEVADDEGRLDETVFDPSPLWQEVWLFVNRLLGSRLS